MAIEVRNITKRYGSVTALDHVSLAMHEGEFVTLLGPSGCGKTTLLRIVAGFIQPDEGEVLIGGTSVNHLPPNRRPTGMVFQSYALFPHMTVAKNISFGLRMRRAPKREVDQAVREAAELVGIEHLLYRYPSQLSGGQQQRVALARTLAIRPKVLLLDEPLAALDRKLRIEMRVDLRKLIEKVGITTIFVTHDQEEALTMSDRIAVMDHGVVVQYGTPMHIYDKPRTTFVASFVGNSNLFRGVIQPGSEGQRVFEGEGLRLPLPPEFRDHVGSPVNLLLRPEHLELCADDNGSCPGDLYVPGTVTFITHLGTAIDYEVRLDTGAMLKVEAARSRDQAPLQEGTRVWVKPVDAASYLVIPDEGVPER